MLRDNKRQINRELGILNCAGSEDLFAEILEVFPKTQRKAFREVEKAIASRDYKLAHRLVHTAKGNADIVGAEQLSEVLETFENALLLQKNHSYTDVLRDYSLKLESVIEEI